MKKSLLYLAYFCLLAISLPAQTPLTKIKLPFSDDTEVFSFTDEDGVTLLFRENGEARLYLLTHDLKVKASYEVFDLPTGIGLQEVGFTNHSESISLYYWEESIDAYRVLSIRKEDGSTSRHSFQIGRERKGHLYWGSFTYNGMLHILRMPRNSQVIRICRFQGEDEFSTNEYEVDRKDFLEKTEYKLNRIENPADLKLHETYLPGKLYQYGEMVHLSLEEGDSTLLVSINLHTGAKEERAYECPIFLFGEEESSKIKTNSMILNQYLYQVAANRDSLSLAIRDLKQGNLINEYRYGKEDFIDIRHGEMEFVESTGKSYPLRDTKELLVQIDDAEHLSITAKPENDTNLVSLTVGAVQISSIVGVSGVVLDEKIDVAFFRSVLDTWRFEPHPGPLAEVSDRRAWMSNLPGKTHWKAKGKSFWGYYDTNLGEYVIGN